MKTEEEVDSRNVWEVTSVGLGDGIWGKHKWGRQGGFKVTAPG